MFWAIPAALSLAGIGSGAAKNSAARKQQQQTANIRAAEIEASPWTKMAPQTQIQFAGSPVGDMIGGAAQGLSLAQMGGQMFGGGEGGLSMGADASAGANASSAGSQDFFNGDYNPWSRMAGRGQAKGPWG